MTLSAVVDNVMASAQTVVEGELQIGTKLTQWALQNPLALLALIMLFISLSFKLYHSITNS